MPDKSDHPDKALDACRFVVIPHLVALHQVIAAAPAANLTATLSILIGL